MQTNDPLAEVAGRSIIGHGDQDSNVEQSSSLSHFANDIAVNNKRIGEIADAVRRAADILVGCAPPTEVGETGTPPVRAGHVGEIDASLHAQDDTINRLQRQIHRLLGGLS